MRREPPSNGSTPLFAALASVNLLLAERDRNTRWEMWLGAEFVGYRIPCIRGKAVSCYFRAEDVFWAQLRTYSSEQY